MKSLNEVLGNINYSVDESFINDINKYIEFLLVENEKFNLTSITDLEEIYIKHILDSLTSVKYINDNDSVIDIGSGAGFPSIPLKLYNKSLKITMVDSLNKRVKFLNSCIEMLNLNNCEAIHSRAEDLAKTDKREFFNVCLARAVAPLNILAEYCLPFVKVGGVFIAYKAEAENEINSSKNAITKLGGKIKHIEKFTLPNTDIHRTLIIIEKISRSDIIYPRSKNLPKIAPLV